MKIHLRLPRHTYRRISRGGGIRFERAGPNGLLVFRLFAAVLLGGFALMPPAALYAFSDGRILSVLLAFPLFTVFPWYPVLGVMAYVLGEATGSWRWLEIDAERRGVRARRDAFLLLGHRTLEWSSRELASMTLQLSRDAPGGAPSATLEIGYQGLDLPVLGSERRRVFTLRQEALRDRHRFFGLAFDIARTLEWGGYRIERDDHLETSILLLRSTRDARAVPPPEPEMSTPLAAGGEAGPSHAGPLHPGASTAGGTGPRRSEAPWEAPSIDLPPFDPSSLEGSGYEVTEWAPGDRVAVRKPGLRGRRLFVAALGGTLVLNLPTLAAGVAIFTGAAGEIGLFWKLVVLGVFAFVTILYNGFLLTEGRARREAVFDWTDGTLRVTLDRRERVVPLEAVEGVDVRGIEHHRRRAGGSSRSYGCEVHVRTSQGEALLLESGSGPARDASYRAAASFAEDLSEALEVDWSWRGWRSRSLWDSVRRLIDRIEARV